MNRAICEDNLTRLQVELQQYATANSIVPKIGKCRDLGNQVFLAHSTSEKNSVTVCESGKLLSPAALAALKGTPLQADSPVSQTNTTEFVFLYAGVFRYPGTGCGWLFNHQMEEPHRGSGAASPFDSGGLVRYLTRKDPAEPILDFLSRHELPLPEHRNYLCDCLELLFDQPDDYLTDIGPARLGNIGISGGDSRRWTHEVRLPDQVSLRTADLEAFFVARNRVADPEIKKMVRWCRLQGIHYEVYSTPRTDDFSELQRKCLAYVRQKLL